MSLDWRSDARWRRSLRISATRSLTTRTTPRGSSMRTQPLTPECAAASADSVSGETIAISAIGGSLDRNWRATGSSSDSLPG
jgi:hypothetical protein